MTIVKARLKKTMIRKLFNNSKSVIYSFKLIKISKVQRKMIEALFSTTSHEYVTVTIWAEKEDGMI